MWWFVGLGFALMPALCRALSGQAAFLLNAFQERKEQVLSQPPRAADELCFTLCSSLSPSSSSDLETCKQRLDVVSPVLFIPGDEQSCL